MSKIRLLPPLLAKKATEELNENPERVQSDIEHIRDWISKQPHLKSRTSDQFLVTFLRGNKFSLEKAKQKLDLFYTLRGRMPELFSDRDVDDPKTMEILKLGVGIKLPVTNGEDGPRVSIIRPGVYDPNKFTLLEVLKVGTMVGDIALLEDDNAVICGHIEILDLANVTAGHLFQLEPTLLKKITMIGQEATPLRHKGFHVINAPPGSDTLFNMFKGFMSEKNRNRVFIHGNLESLYEHVPRKLFPVEYGGENTSISEILTYWEMKLTEYRDYFIEDKNYGTDERLRRGTPPINEETLFGLDGSFRKLNVD